MIIVLMVIGIVSIILGVATLGYAWRTFNKISAFKQVDVEAAVSQSFVVVLYCSCMALFLKRTSCYGQTS